MKEIHYSRSHRPLPWVVALVVSVALIMPGAAQAASSKSGKVEHKISARGSDGSSKSSAPSRVSVSSSAARTSSSSRPSSAPAYRPSSGARSGSPTYGTPAVNSGARVGDSTYRSSTNAPSKPAYRPNTTTRTPSTPTYRGSGAVQTAPTYRPGTGTSRSTETYKSPSTGNNSSTYRPPSAPSRVEASKSPSASKNSPAYRPPSSSSSRSTESYRDTRPAKTVDKYRPTAGASRTDRNEPSRKPDERYKPSNKSTDYRPSTVYVRTRPDWTRHGDYKNYRRPVYTSGYYHYSSWVSDPCRYGHWAFEYYPNYSRRSFYYHYGVFPYVHVSRVYVSSYPRVIYVGDPVYANGNYYLDRDRYGTLDDALADVRAIWLSGRIDILERRVLERERMAILIDGRYDYSITGRDYIDMTADAIRELDTYSFTWDNVRKRSDGAYTAFGTHRYSEDGYLRTVYVSYTLERIGSEYYITEVGSSLSRLY